MVVRSNKAQKDFTVFDKGSSDEELMKLVTVGSQEAFAEIFERYAKRVKSLMVKLGATTVDAEEMSQEVMALTWVKAKQYEEKKGTVASWIYRISRNYRIDLLRKRKYLEIDQNDPLFVPDTELTAQQILMEKEKRVKIEKAFANLRPETRIILVENFFEGRTHQELANKFDKPLGTIKSSLRLAYSFLKNCLEPADFKKD